ncbi:anti-sigma factor family protein [Microtetraspora glauca]|uniref:Zf-HC2 domain-containing protein n=1 Tax=Microtetraspora glauca TaxID=1996 RepID=A0ABV3GIW5_MICGL
MTGDTHYDLEILAELAEGLLDDATARRVREHLAICDPCGESLADLAAVREVLAAVPVPAMPLGVAMRIDRALAAESSRDLGDGGLRVVETPDWDRIMRDAPWETAPQEETAPAVPAAATLGVVADDGTIVPVATKKRRRLWAMPAVAAAAAAVVIGGTGVATTVLSAQGGGSTPYVASQADPSSDPTASELKATTYTVSASGHNYTNRELSGPLLGYFGVGPASDTTDDEPLDKCVRRFSNQLDRKPIGVDKALYNGNEATIMAFWEDKNINAVRVVVVDSSCKSLRPESLASWN